MTIKIAPLAVAISLATTVQAAPVTELEKVVVSASRSQASISNISGTVQVISQDDIVQQSQPGQKLADVLEKLVPGFGPSTQTVTDRTQSVRGRRALILIDGISQADNRQISRHLTTIRPENIERIEVISGASAIYGGGATGGVINVITRKPAGDEIRFSSEAGIKISDGDLTTYTLNQSVSGRMGDADYLVSGTYESRGALFDANGNRINPDPSQVSRMDTDSKDLLVKLGYDLDVGQRLDATVQYFDDQMDSEYAPDISSLAKGKPADSPAAVKGLKLEKQPYSKRQSIDLVYSNDALFGHNFKAQTYYREREARFFPYPNLIGNKFFVNQSLSSAEVFGIKLNLDRELDTNFRISYGLDYDVDSGEQRGQLHSLAKYLGSGGKVIEPTGAQYEYGPDVEAKTLGLYLQTSYDITRQLTANAGLRHERAKVDIGDYMPLAETWFMPEAMRTLLAGAERKYDDSLFNVGLVYRLSDSQEVFANYSQGFEVPDASRILRNAVSPASMLAANPVLNGTNVAEANLDAIKTDSFDLGWRGQFANLLGNVSAFYNESDKTINFNAEHNVDLLDQQRKVYGVEGSIEYFLNDNWSVGGSYAFTEGRSYYKAIGQWLDLQAADVSPQKFTSFVTYGQEDLNIRLQSTTFSDYDKGKSFSASKKTVKDRDIEGYTTVDMLVSYQLPVGTIKAGISNLLNEDYETVYSQWARTTYSGISAHKAEGRTYNLSYRLEY